MGKPQRRFGKEFEAEAVRLVEVSGRTQREIAMDLGVGLSPGPPAVRQALGCVRQAPERRFAVTHPR